LRGRSHIERDIGSIVWTGDVWRTLPRTGGLSRRVGRGALPQEAGTGEADKAKSTEHQHRLLAARHCVSSGRRATHGLPTALPERLCHHPSQTHRAAARTCRCVRALPNCAVPRTPIIGTTLPVFPRMSI
jgi:hypothetical protein